MVHAIYKDSEGDIHWLEAFRRGSKVYARVPIENDRVAREIDRHGVIDFDNAKWVAVERINDVFYEFGRH